MFLKTQIEYHDYKTIPGWNQERLVTSLMNGRVIKVLPTDPQFMRNKVVGIREVVDQDLGFEAGEVLTRGNSLTHYLYVHDDGHVIGLVACEPLTIAFRLIPSSSGRVDGAMVTSKVGEPVDCGVCWSVFIKFYF